MRDEYDFTGATRGAVIPSPGKTRITIMIDDDIIAFFRDLAESQGSGYQTMMNAALRRGMAELAERVKAPEPLTASTLRRILREELRAAKAR